MKSFPTIWFRGNEAGFWFHGRLVRVPLKFGSNDRSLHVIPWLRRLWPLHIKEGRLVKIIYTDGIEKEVALHRYFATAAHRDIGFDFDRITAVDGDFLHWTAENIRPVRNPNKPATAKEKKNEVERQLLLGEKGGGSLWVGPLRDDYVSNSPRKFLTRALAKFLHANEDILTKEQSVELNTRAVNMITEAETKLAADFTVGEAERNNHEQHDEGPLLDDVAEWLTDDEKPAKSKRVSGVSDTVDEPDSPDDIVSNQGTAAIVVDTPVVASPCIVKEVPVPPLTPIRVPVFEKHPITGRYERTGKFATLLAGNQVRYISTTLEVILHHDNPKQAHREGTARVFRILGWHIPASGHDAVYEGKEPPVVWARTPELQRVAFSKATKRPLPDPKFCAPSEPIPVREVSVNPTIPCPRLQPDKKSDCECFGKDVPQDILDQHFKDVVAPRMRKVAEELKRQETERDAIFNEPLAPVQYGDCFERMMYPRANAKHPTNCVCLKDKGIRIRFVRFVTKPNCAADCAKESAIRRVPS